MTIIIYDLLLLLTLHFYIIAKFNKKTNCFKDNRYTMKYGLHYPDSSHYNL